MRTPCTWDETFIRVAQAMALRSKDPLTQVGCVIVHSQTHEVLGVGYNGFPPGVIETPERWEKANKKKYVRHAEVNAIDRSNKPLQGAKLYVTLTPCLECCKSIISKGISEVVYLEHRDYLDGLELLAEVNVTVRKVDL